MESLGLRREDVSTQVVPARPPRRAARRRSRSRAPGSSASRPRSATCSAPRSARCRSRSAPARRAPRRCPTSATRSSPSGSPGWRGYCAATRRPASRTSRSGTSATSPTPAPSGWCCPTRRSCSTTCSTSRPGSSSEMTVDAERMRANLELTHGALFSQRALTALVESGMSRDDAYRLVQRTAQRAFDEGIPFRELIAATRRRPRPRRGLRLQRLPRPRARAVVRAAREARCAARRPVLRRLSRDSMGAAAAALSRATTTGVPRFGEKVMLRRVTPSGSIARRPAARQRPRTSRSTIRISNSAKLAPRQRRTPPPNGIQA